MIESSPPDVAAITTAIIAVIGTVIATLQWMTMRQDKWIQLFDRRYQLYRDMGRAAAECTQEGQIGLHSEEAFREGAHLGPILFGRKSAPAFEAMWQAAYWRSGALKPKDWPNEADGTPRSPVDVISDHWKTLRPQLVAALTRWR